MALPRKFLNDDEELLAELHPHWIFLFGPLFTSIGVWAALIVLLILWRNPPGWTNYPIIVTRPHPRAVAAGPLRPLEVLRRRTDLDPDPGAPGNLRTRHRAAAPAARHRGQPPPVADRAGARHRSLVIDVQGEDDSLTLEYMRKPASGAAGNQLPDQRAGGRRSARGDPARHAARWSNTLGTAPTQRAPTSRTDAGTTLDHDAEQDTPPFGVEVPPEPRPLWHHGGRHRRRFPSRSVTV